MFCHADYNFILSSVLKSCMMYVYTNFVRVVFLITFIYFIFYSFNKTLCACSCILHLSIQLRAATFKYFILSACILIKVTVACYVTT